MTGKKLYYDSGFYYMPMLYMYIPGKINDLFCSVLVKMHWTRLKIYFSLVNTLFIRCIKKLNLLLFPEIAKT